MIDRRIFGFEYLVMKPSDLEATEQLLVEAAWEARKNAYCVYSNFAVGAAIETMTGDIFAGSNSEDMAYSGSCAEYAVVSNIQSAGQIKEARAIAIVGGPLRSEAGEKIDGTHGVLCPISPCGRCRQHLVEVEDRINRALRVIMAGTNEVWVVDGIRRNLLPLAFEL